MPCAEVSYTDTRLSGADSCNDTERRARHISCILLTLCFVSVHSHIFSFLCTFSAFFPFSFHFFYLIFVFLYSCISVSSFPPFYPPLPSSFPILFSFLYPQSLFSSPLLSLILSLILPLPLLTASSPLPLYAIIPTQPLPPPSHDPFPVLAFCSFWCFGGLLGHWPSYILGLFCFIHFCHSYPVFFFFYFCAFSYFLLISHLSVVRFSLRSHCLFPFLFSLYFLS